MALRKRDDILHRNLSIISTNLKLLDDFFARHSHMFEWHRPSAGSIGFVRCLPSLC